jgi:hypothetical protein
MDITLGTASLKLHIEDPLEPKDNHGLAFPVYLTSFPDAGIGSEKLTVLGHKGREIGAPDFLLAFN